MLKRFAAALLGAPRAGERRDPIGHQLATCVLLVDAACSDEHFTPEEREHIREVMQRRFSRLLKEYEQGEEIDEGKDAGFPA